MATVIVTGGAGFIGSNLVEYLLENTGYDVAVLDALTYAGDFRNLREFVPNNRFHFVEGNICNRPLLDFLFHKYQPIGIFHLAAESHVDNSIKSSDEFIQTNIVGTHRLLEASVRYKEEYGRENRKFRFLHVSTDEVYGSLLIDGKRFNEDCTYHPNSPYSASKAASDHLVTAYHETFGLNTVITHCSNNYGPKQHREKLIPKTILNILDRKEIPIYGNGLNIRDWIHVKDHCAGLLEVYRRGSSGESYCIGGNNERTNLSIAESLCESTDLYTGWILNSSKSLISHVEDRKGHDFRYAIDSSKMFREFEWEPKIPFDKGLLETIQWYDNNRGWIK